MIFECPQCKQWVEIWATDDFGKFHKASGSYYAEKVVVPSYWDGNFASLIMKCPDDGAILVERRNDGGD